MKIFSGIAAAALALCCMFFVTDAAPAQAQANSWKCMAWGQAADPFFVIVPANRVGELRSRGFEVRDCEGREQNLAEYRQKICALADGSTEQTLMVFRQIYGVGLEEFCEMVRDPR